MTIDIPRVALLENNKICVRIIDVRKHVLWAIPLVKVKKS